MSLFDRNAHGEFVAMQSMHYDRYSGCSYFLERVEVDGKCGLTCGEQSDEYGTHARVLLPPIYRDIQVSKISSRKALYSKYEVYADGTRVGHFTLVLNAWMPA